MQTQAMTSDDFDLAKFIKLMKMTTATIDGEALAAMRMANKMLRANGHDWEQLLKGKITIVNDPFGSIPTPPAAKAAPPPPPPPQRTRRDSDIPNLLVTILAESGILSPVELQQFNAISADWNAYNALFDAQYRWLTSTANQVTPRPRDRAQVQQFFDVVEFAPLDAGQTTRFNRIRAEWNRRNDNKMNDSDYYWIERLYQRHVPRGARGGKAKRLI